MEGNLRFPLDFTYHGCPYIVLDGVFQRMPLTAEIIDMSLAMGIILHVTEASRQEHSELKSAFHKGLVTRDEFNEECRRIERAKQGALDRYARLINLKK